MRSYGLSKYCNPRAHALSVNETEITKTIIHFFSQCIYGPVIMVIHSSGSVCLFTMEH